MVDAVVRHTLNSRRWRRRPVSLIAAVALALGGAVAMSSVTAYAASTSAADVTAPTTPTGLTATATSTTEIVLHWTASTDAVGVTGYVVWRDGTQVGTTSSTTYTDAALSPGQTHAYTVTAQDAAGNTSLPSDSASTTTLTLDDGMVDVTAPSVPAGLRVDSTTDTTVTLSWAASTDNPGGLGVYGYVVTRNGEQVAMSMQTSYTDANLSPGTTYTYSVAARDPANNTSAWADSVSATTKRVGATLDVAEWFQIVNLNSKMCIDTDGGTANGTRLQQRDCADPAANNQLWQFRSVGDGYYKVVSRQASSISWDVTGGPGATGNGTDVQLWSYVGGSNQQWLAVDLGDGRYEFVARNSGKCLDVRDVSTSSGASLQQWTCAGGPAQTFAMKLVNTGSGRPALTNVAGRVAVAWTGSAKPDNAANLNIGWLDATGTSVQKAPPLGEATLANEGPALTDDGSRVDGVDATGFILAWPSSDHTLKALYYGAHGATCLTSFAGILTAHSPALAHAENAGPTIAWVDPDSHLNVGTLDTSTCLDTGKITMRTRVVLPDTSSAGPSLAADTTHPELGMMLAWTGTDAGHHVHIATYDGTAVLTQRGTVDAPVGASGAPSLTNRNSDNYLAFRGTDGLGYFGYSQGLVPSAYTMHGLVFAGGLGSDIGMSNGNYFSAYFDNAGRLHVSSQLGH